METCFVKPIVSNCAVCSNKKSTFIKNYEFSND